MLAEGDIYEVTTKGYSSDGAAVARIDGQVVFLAGALDGETCRVRIDHVGHRAAWGSVQAILAPSPARQSSDCPLYPACGGCQLRHMTYAEELRFKSGKVTDALRRIGGLEVDTVPIHAAAEPLRYRNKIQFPAAPGGKLGFYAGGTHRVLDVPDCLLQPVLAARARQAARDYLAAWDVPAYDEATGRGLLRHLFLRFNAAGEVLVCLLVNGEALPQEPRLVEALREALGGALRGVVLGVNRRRDNVILGDRYRTLWGQDYLLDTLRGLTFKISVPSFFQVNRAQAEVLYALAEEFAGLTGAETLLDLYCGAGTIGLTMAHAAGALIGAEIVPQAVEDAWENARRNGVENARFLLADAAQAARELADQGLRPHVVVVDPPRKGLAPQVVEAIFQMAPGRVVYVSCDCATLARDLKRFAPRYSLSRAEAVDLFPRTQHVETVVLLSRREL